jgi:hypothetical protein
MSLLVTWACGWCAVGTLGGVVNHAPLPLFLGGVFGPTGARPRVHRVVVVGDPAPRASLLEILLRSVVWSGPTTTAPLVPAAGAHPEGVCGPQLPLSAPLATAADTPPTTANTTLVEMASPSGPLWLEVLDCSLPPSPHDHDAELEPAFAAAVEGACLVLLTFDAAAEPGIVEERVGGLVSQLRMPKRSTLTVLPVGLHAGQCTSFVLDASAHAALPVLSSLVDWAVIPPTWTTVDVQSLSCPLVDDVVSLLTSEVRGADVADLPPSCRSRR